MFIETHSDNDITLAFIKSGNVRAYPCGRRRSTEIDRDGSNITTEDKYRIPFDPEARLNTEANALKHSSMNGYTQTYIKQFNDDNSNLFELALGGYLFSIDLRDNDDSYASVDKFCEKLLISLGVTEPSYIFANILIEDVHLYSGFQEYFTGILRNQKDSAGETPETSLDLLRAARSTTAGQAVDTVDAKNPADYYFSGLSFSVAPLAGSIPDDVPYYVKPLAVERDTTTVNQTCISLRLFEKIEGEWKLYNQALLPEISHGPDAHSVKVAILSSDAISANNLDANNKVTAPMAEIGSLSAKNILVTAEEGIEGSGKIGTVDSKVPEMWAQKINATALSVGSDTSVISAAAGTVTAPTFIQKIEDTNYPVPAITLVESGSGEFQLQILRVRTTTD